MACYRKRFSSFDMWGQTETLKCSVFGPELEANWNKERNNLFTRYHCQHISLFLFIATFVFSNTEMHIHI